jgi:hypothetical protein
MLSTLSFLFFFIYEQNHQKMHCSLKDVFKKKKFFAINTDQNYFVMSLSHQQLSPYLQSRKASRGGDGQFRISSPWGQWGASLECGRSFWEVLS